MKKVDKLRKIGLAVTAIIMAIFAACSDSEPWDELPEKISNFVTQYFPNTGLDSFSESTTTYHVRMSNGPGMTFNKDCEWEAINGYGMPLPQVLLFDQLPPALYKYLEETENLNSVFSLERDSSTYTVVLLDTTLTYDIQTQEITGTTHPKS
ncbi:MAG: hypothetical protein K2M77_08165 [Muribaculaceae bacterium]|nr:hypothetical protein [Muribaculaceae bacterium]